ncbi:MAG TPA: Rab family GTPase [candidate division Zixibacteria bacterium]|nr:Rab family GTPase [candidate division Zixibacteria bacterium]
MAEIDKEFVFKVVLMGDGSVGKTSIRSKFMGVGFKSEYIKTIGADFASKAIVLGHNKVHFQIWDLAGQKMYKHVRSSFYSGCKCGFLVCDLTQPSTLESLDTWVEEALEHSGGYLKIFIILGNKHDLIDQRKVKQEEIEKLLSKLKSMKDIEAAYLETSALTGENINEAFEIMGKMFLEKEGFPQQGAEEEQGIITPDIPQVDLIDLQKAPNNEEKNQENEDTNLHSIITKLYNRINRLSEIITSLEERMILIETKKLSKEDAIEINDLREKIESIDKEMVTLTGYTTAQDEIPTTNDLDMMVPTPPTMDEIEDIEEKKEDFEKIDRSSLELMEVIEENDDEESITEILVKTEEQPIEQEVKVEEKKKTKTQSQTKCPKCGSKLSFIKQYNRWYCYRCKIYV